MPHEALAREPYGSRWDRVWPARSAHSSILIDIDLRLPLSALSPLPSAAADTPGATASAHTVRRLYLISSLALCERYGAYRYAQRAGERR